MISKLKTRLVLFLNFLIAYCASSPAVLGQNSVGWIDTSYFHSYRISEPKTIQSITFWQDSSSKKVVEYYRSGALRSTQHYSNDKAEGEHQFYYENGNTWKILRYKNGHVIKTIVWSASGNLSYKSENIVVGDRALIHGNYIAYYNSGQISKKGTYDSGKYHKTWVEYYESGNKKSIKNYKRGNLVGKSIFWNQSGKKVGIYNYVYDSKLRKSVFHKKQIRYHKNGELWSNERYKNGKKDGVSKEWYLNGELKSEIEFKDGLNYGKNNSYFPSGKPKRIMNYYSVVDSSQPYNYKNYYDGEYIEYYQNGLVRVSKNYKDGKQNGEERNYYNDGKIKSVKIYTKGLSDGKTEYWNEKGVLVYLENFKVFGLADSLYTLKHGTYSTFNGHGDTTQYGVYEKGKKLGVWKTWDKEGRMTSWTQYCGGLICGNQKKWENGKISYLGSYSITERDGDKNSYPIGNHITYLNGIQVKKSIHNDSGYLLRTVYYYPNGKLKELRIHILPPKVSYESVQTGRIYTFYENGLLRSAETRINGRYASGMSRFYYMNGQPSTFKFWPVSFNDDTGFSYDWDSKGGIIIHKEFTSYNQFLTVKDFENTKKVHNHLVQTRRDAAYFDTFSFSHPLIETHFDGSTEFRYDHGGESGEGIVQMFHMNGNPFLNLKLKDGIAQGEYQLMAANKYPIEVGHFNKGKPVQVWKYYNKKDTLRKVLIYHDQTQKFYTQTDYHKNGTPKQIVTYKNGRQEDAGLGYYDNGVLQFESHFKNGRLDSVSKRFYKTGQLQYLSKYKNGQRHGLEQGWFNHGIQQYEQHYKKGKLDSLYIAFWSNGKLRSRGYYKEGMKDSTWLIYNESGDLKSQYKYRNGKLVSNYQKTLCSCKEEVPKKMSYVPMLKNLNSLEEVHKLSFNYHAPIGDFYNSLFYKRFQFSNSSKSRFRSLTILSFDEAYVYLPNQNGIKLILNPCFRQPGTYSEIPIRVSSEDGNKDALNISLEPGRVALEFSPILLRQWDSAYSNPKVVYSGSKRSYLGAKIFFDVYELTYNNQGYIGLKNVRNTCFTPSEIGNTGVKLRVHKATVNLNPDKERLNYSYRNASNEFYKYVQSLNRKFDSYGRVNINAAYADSSTIILPKSIFGGSAKDTLQLTSTDLLISNNSVIVGLEVQAELNQGLSYKIKLGKTEKIVPAQDIANGLKSLGLSAPEIKFNNNTNRLIIHFHYSL